MRRFVRFIFWGGVSGFLCTGVFPWMGAGLRFCVEVVSVARNCLWRAVKLSPREVLDAKVTAHIREHVDTQRASHFGEGPIREWHVEEANPKPMFMLPERMEHHVSRCSLRRRCFAATACTRKRDEIFSICSHLQATLPFLTICTSRVAVKNHKIL